MKGIQQKQMGANLDNELFNTAKEKRTKKLKDENFKKQSKSNNFDQFENFIGKTKFSHKDEKVFRKNQRRFEYDYEEDFYEPEKQLLIRYRACKK